MRKRSKLLVGVAISLALGSMLAGCQKSPPQSEGTATQAPAATEWKKLVDALVESDLKANPNAGTYLGRHEFDGLFPDWSEAGLAAEIQRLKDFHARATAADAAGLDDAAKFERDYLLSVIDGRLFWLETADWPHRNPVFYGFDPTVYLDRPYGDLARRMKDYSRWASNLPAAAAQVKANLKGPLPKAYIDIGMHTFGPLSDFLKTDVVKVFAGCGRSGAARRVRQAERRGRRSAGGPAEAPGIAAQDPGQRFRHGRGPVREDDLRQRTGGYAAGRARADRPCRHEAQPGRAQGSLREVRARKDAEAVLGQGMRPTSLRTTTPLPRRASSWST